MLYAIAMGQIINDQQKKLRLEKTAIATVFFKDGGPNYTKFLEGIHPSSTLTKFVLDVGYIAFFRNWTYLKSKHIPNIEQFAPPFVKLGEGLANCLSLKEIQ